MSNCYTSFIKTIIGIKENKTIIASEVTSVLGTSTSDKFLVKYDLCLIL